MPRDRDNHGNKPKKEKVFFPYERNLLLDTFGQIYGNNGFLFRVSKAITGILFILCVNPFSDVLSRLRLLF